ncbi:MAG: hypothetical protein AAGC71_01575 [Pseudomonadota bacterium]
MTVRYRINSTVCLALAASLSACTAPEPPDSPAIDARCVDDGSGFVEADLFGSVETSVAWADADADCTGMPKPDDSGARLRFAGKAADRDLVVIVGVDRLARGTTGNGFAANVTIIDESTSRFFSNGGVPNCWSDIYRQVELDDDRTRVDGIVYCSGALAAQQSEGSIRLRDLRFRGQIVWTVEDSNLAL